ncbi:MAG TPA: ABC transporter transmembrane domain-containing protein, partial [Pirellulales bacterium]|nr:ABC transporter transmembrane domain-containing protein [Pirellulales bacterium]
MSTASTFKLDRTLTRLDRHEEHEPDERPLDIGLIVRLFSYTRPYASKRNWLFVMVILRSIQMPALTWLVAAIIRGPIAGGDGHGVAIGVLAFLVLAVSTQVVMHFRQRLALELGESVVFDLRNEIFARLQVLPMSFFDRNPVGRLVTRATTDVDALNDLFASGVAAILNDFFYLFGLAAILLAWHPRLALATFSP